MRTFNQSPPKADSNGETQDDIVDNLVAPQGEADLTKDEIEFLGGNAVDSACERPSSSFGEKLNSIAQNIVEAVGLSI